MLRILIADNRETERQGVRDILTSQPGWEVCAEAEDGRQALELGLREKPDVAILDVDLPLLNGIGVTRQLRQSLPKLEVLLFTNQTDEATVSGGLAVGARGYLHRADSDQHLVAAVAALGAHRPYFSSAVSELLMAAALQDRQLSRLDSFTARELEVMRLIADGQSDRQIAEQLAISTRTVESHRAAAMRKAGVRTIAELVRFAIRHKLIRP